MKGFVQRTMLLLPLLCCIFRLVETPSLLLMRTSALMILDDVALLRHIGSSLYIPPSVRVWQMCAEHDVADVPRLP